MHAVAREQLGQVLARCMGVIPDVERVARQLLSIGGFQDSLLQCAALRVQLGDRPPTTLLCIMSMCGEDGAPVLAAVSPDALPYAWPFCGRSAEFRGSVGVYHFHNGVASRLLCGPNGHALMDPEPAVVAADVGCWVQQTQKEMLAQVGGAGGLQVDQARLRAVLPMVGLPAEPAIAEFIVGELAGGVREQGRVTCFFLACTCTGARIMCVAGRNRRVLVAQYGALREAMPMVTGAAAWRALEIRGGQPQRTMAMVVSATGEKLASKLVAFPFPEGAQPQAQPAFSAQQRGALLARTADGLAALLESRVLPALGEAALGEAALDVAALGGLAALATASMAVIEELLRDGDTIENYGRVDACMAQAAAAIEEGPPMAPTPQQYQLCVQEAIEALGMLKRLAQEGGC
jgi:hypothetical protein